MTWTKGERQAVEWRAKKHMRLLDIYEPLAKKSEETADGKLRALYAERYRRLVGVRVEERNEFRHSLQEIHGVTVEQLIGLFAHGR